MHPIPIDQKLLHFEKGAKDELTPDEQTIWDEWKNSEERKPVDIDLDDPELQEEFSLYFELQKGQDERWEEFERKVIFPETEEIFKEFERELILSRQDVAIPEPVPVRSFSYRKALAVAASILLLIAASVALYYGLSKEQPVADVAETREPRTDVFEFIQPPAATPGGKRALLTLADNKERNLEKLNNGLIAYQNATAVIKESDSQLVYQVKNTGNSFEKHPYNTLTTPQGGEYKVTLPDGSNAWLNAGSSLHYPTAFSGNERRVELTGEAYFDIKKDAARPFKVIVKNTSIKVRGTKFNINAYSQDTINTTLIEGTVELEHNQKTMLLKQNQQAIVCGDAIKLNERFNLASVMAWKNGYIYLEGETVASIVNQIKRWYNVKDSIIGNPKISLKGKFPRSFEMNEVLKILNVGSQTEFILEKNILIAKAK